MEIISEATPIGAEVTIKKPDGTFSDTFTCSEPYLDGALNVFVVSVKRTQGTALVVLKDVFYKERKMKPKKRSFEGLNPPFIDNEPVMCFRAKDNVSAVAVHEYMIYLEKYNGDKRTIRKMKRWIAERMDWRAAHPELCKDPD